MGIRSWEVLYLLGGEASADLLGGGKTHATATAIRVRAEHRPMLRDVTHPTREPVKASAKPALFFPIFTLALDWLLTGSLLVEKMCRILFGM